MQLRRAIASSCLHGVDLDPAAVELARALFETGRVDEGCHAAAEARVYGPSDTGALEVEPPRGGVGAGEGARRAGGGPGGVGRHDASFSAVHAGAPDQFIDLVVAGAAVTYLEGYLWDRPEAKAAYRVASEIAHMREPRLGPGEVGYLVTGLTDVHLAKVGDTITAASATLRYSCGPYYGMWAELGAMTAFACYNLENVKSVGYDVITNRPKQAAYRAPGAPMSAFAVEGVVNELAERIGMDPIDLRLKNAAKEGYKTIYGDVFGPIGFVETLEAAKRCEHYNAPKKPGTGRGVAAGFWFNRGGETSTSLNVAPDGSVTVIIGTADVAGSRIAISMMAAEELGIPVDKVHVTMADTNSLGFNRAGLAYGHGTATALDLAQQQSVVAGLRGGDVDAE